MSKPAFFSDWETLYKDQDVEKMPWYHPMLDHDFERILKERHILNGAVLDLGTGPGTQAIALAERGFKVVATDISESAIKKAAETIRGKGLAIDFRRDDIVETKLGETFDIILDRGCFHVLEESKRATYVRHLDHLLKKGGFLLLKTFSAKESMQDGPHRFTPQDIREIFTPGFTICSAEESFFMGNHKPDPCALFCVIQKQ